MRVLFVANELSSYFCALGKFLIENGVEAHAICFNQSRREGVRVHPISSFLRADNFFDRCMLLNLELVRRIRELMETRDLELIHASGWEPLIGATISSRCFSKPLVITFSSIERERGMDKPHSEIIQKLELDAANDASAVIVTSEELGRSLVELGIPKEKVNAIVLEGEWPRKVLEVYARVIE